MQKQMLGGQGRSEALRHTKKEAVLVSRLLSGLADWLL